MENTTDIEAANVEESKLVVSEAVKEVMTEGIELNGIRLINIHWRINLQDFYRKLQ